MFFAARSEMPTLTNVRMRSVTTGAVHNVYELDERNLYQPMEM